MIARTCSVEGCQRPYYAKGFCAHHYHKNRNSMLAATKKPVWPTAPQRKCVAWLCEEPVYGMGVCEKHYKEWRMEEVGGGIKR